MRVFSGAKSYIGAHTANSKTEMFANVDCF